jgi:hypothetical protein
MFVPPDPFWVPLEFGGLIPTVLPTPLGGCSVPPEIGGRWMAPLFDGGGRCEFAAGDGCDESPGRASA